MKVFILALLTLSIYFKANAEDLKMIPLVDHKIDPLEALNFERAGLRVSVERAESVYKRNQNTMPVEQAASIYYNTLHLIWQGTCKVETDFVTYLAQNPHLITNQNRALFVKFRDRVEAGWYTQVVKNEIAEKRLLEILQTEAVVLEQSKRMNNQKQ